jgi:hypothetical protein
MSIVLKSPSGLRASIAGSFFFVLALAAPPVLASTSLLVFVFGPPAPQHLLAPAQGQPGSITGIPLTLNPNGQTIFGARLLTLGIAGTNADDFAIVPGGTCEPGTTTLFPTTTTTGSSCTVNVRYTPSSPAAETALLTASCTPIGIAGGFSVVCEGAVGNVASLVGSLFQPVPALSPPLLTALAATLFALGAFGSLRRPGSTTGRR